MPLNLPTNDGEFTPYLKYNAKAGRFYVKPEGEAEDVEIITPTLAFDMANIKTGWVYFPEGGAPQKVWDTSLTQAAPRPDGPKWRRGFEVHVFSNGTIPGTNQKIGRREFMSTAGNVIGPIRRMYEEYEAGMAENKGRVPVFACERVKPINSQHGTNYEPVFTLQTWVERAKIPDFKTPVAHTQQYDERNPPPPEGDDIPW